MRDTWSLGIYALISAQLPKKPRPVEEFQWFGASEGSGYQKETKEKETSHM
jgi:hypothetical protein